MMLNRIPLSLPFVFLVLMAAFFNWYCSSSTVVDAETLARNRTSYAGLSDSAQYVGITVCAGCHPNVHETFMHTGMGKSFGKASTEKSSGDFKNNPVVHDIHRNLYYSPVWKNDSLFFREFRIEGRDTTHFREEKIDYIVGSGQHTNSHIWVSNGYAYQAPITFYTQKGIWDLPPGFEKGNNSGFNRKIGLECMSCHNGLPDFQLGSSNKYNLIKQGIDCERCHGPGSIHVQEKSKGILIDTSKYVDYSIVNPSKLPIDLQFDVCQRCHIQGNAVLNEGKSFLDFKPGMKLSDVMHVFMPVYKDGTDQHIMASHAERLKMSRCFLVTAEKENQRSGGSQNTLRPYKNALTCITCHNPHVSVKQTSKDHFNTVCGNCHGGTKSSCSESDKKRLLKKNDCVSCHMPVNGATDIPHVSVHDHRIGIQRINVNRPTTSRELKSLSHIICVHEKQPPAESIGEAYINYVEKFNMPVQLLDSALHYLPHRTPSEVRKNIHALIRIAYLKKDIRSLQNYLKLVPGLVQQLNRRDPENRDAWTSYRISELVSSIPSPSNPADESLKWAENAWKLAPYDPDFTNKYANQLIQTGRQKEARRILSELVKEHPEFAPGFCNLGFLILQTDNNTTEAIRLLRRAILLDPDYELAYLNLASVYLSLKDWGNARTYLQKAVQINPANSQAVSALQQLKNLL